MYVLYLYFPPCFHVSSLRSSDYIHDNCDHGKTERYNLYCNLMLAPNTYDELQSTCDELGGQLTWFDTMQEFSVLTGRFSAYHPDPFNGFLYTGNFLALPR